MITLVLLFIVVLIIVVFVVVRIREGLIRNPSDGMKIVFEDTFNGNQLDQSKWTIFTQPDPTHSCAVYENPGQISVNNGLNIGIKPKDGGGYSSGRLFSTQQFKYGYYEIKAKMNGFSNMMWPAFWLTPQTNLVYGPWPQSGEIDIMEAVNNVGTNISTLHCNNTKCNCGGQQSYYCCGTASNGIHAASANVDFSQWHTYGCLWEEGKLSFYLDGNQTGSILTSDGQFAPCWINGNKNSPFDIPMNIILNLAIGGDWAGANTGCKCVIGSDGNCVGYGGCTLQNCTGLNTNGSLQVEYVKVWQK